MLTTIVGNDQRCIALCDKRNIQEKLLIVFRIKSDLSANKLTDKGGYDDTPRDPKTSIVIDYISRYNRFYKKYG